MLASQAGAAGEQASVAASIKEVLLPALPQGASAELEGQLSEAFPLAASMVRLYAACCEALVPRKPTASEHSACVAHGLYLMQACQELSTWTYALMQLA